MNVYIVYEEDYDATLIYGVFITREMAQAHIETMSETYENANRYVAHSRSPNEPAT
jgi:hypothetical protein